MFISNAKDTPFLISVKFRQLKRVANKTCIPFVWMKQVLAPALCLFVIIPKRTNYFELNSPYTLYIHIGRSPASTGTDSLSSQAVCNLNNDLRFPKWPNSWLK